MGRRVTRQRIGRCHRQNMLRTYPAEKKKPAVARGSKSLTQKPAPCGVDGVIHVAKLTLGIEVRNPTLKRPSPERASGTRLRRKRSSANLDRAPQAEPERT